MKRVIIGDYDSGIKWFNENLCIDGNSLTYTERKKQLLIDFGVPNMLVDMWMSGNKNNETYGNQMEHLLAMLEPGMNRMHPDGVTRLGLYSKSIGDVLSGHCEDDNIVDYGCGPWADSSQYFGSRLSKSTVKLVDICPMPLAFAAYQLDRAGVKNTSVLVEQGSDSSTLIDENTALIIEATAFEHVVDIRHLFPKMMEALPSGGLFLTNYTRLDWTNPGFDGFQENKDFAPHAVEAAMDLAYRYEWNPVQPAGEGWDLWERK